MNKAKTRIKQKALTFDSEFISMELTSDAIFNTTLIPQRFIGKIDCIACFNGLDATLKSEGAFQTLFSNLSLLLRDEGYFFGIMMVYIFFSSPLKKKSAKKIIHNLVLRRLDKKGKNVNFFLIFFFRMLRCFVLMFHTVSIITQNSLLQ